MELWPTLGHILILLSGAFIAGGLFSRFGQSPLLGYILAGMFLGGPGSLGIVGSEHEIELLAELGVTLLLFSLGLEFSIERLKSLGVRPLLGGVLQVVITICIGWGAASALGFSLLQSAAFGMMISLSSTAVVLRILTERAQIDSPHGRKSLAVLLIQDMAVVPLALLMTVLGKGGGSASNIASELGLLALMAIGLMAVLYLLCKLIVPVLGKLTLHRNRELNVLFAVIAGLGSAWLAHEVGISPALGAFAAGMILGSSLFATQIRADVASFRVVLLTLFFGSAGMLADPLWLIENMVLVLSVTTAIIIVKAGLIWAIFKVLGFNHRVALSTGLSLAQLGEFAFVLGGIGRVSGLVTEELYALVISVTIVSFAISAFLVPRAGSIGYRLQGLLGQADDTGHLRSEQTVYPNVLIIGYGPAGQLAAHHLADYQTTIMVLDLNANSVAIAQKDGLLGQVGDATHKEVLEHIHLEQCESVVITIPDHECALSICDHIRHLAPHAKIYVRCRYQRHVECFEVNGYYTVGDENEVGHSIGKQLAQQFL